VAGTRLESGATAAIVPGQIVELGAAMLVLHRLQPIQRRYLWSHSYFEARLEEACARGRATGNKADGMFGVVRLRIEGDASSVSIRDLMTKVLRVNDVVASYAPGEYEILLEDTATVASEDLVERLWTELSQTELSAKVGLACFPGDGLTPETL